MFLFILFKTFINISGLIHNIRLKEEMARQKKEKIEEEKNPDAFGISGFTLGIVSLVTAFLGTLVTGLLFSIAGLTFSLMQQKKKMTRKGKIGVILNIIAIIVNIGFWVLYAKFLYPLIQQQAA